MAKLVNTDSKTFFAGMSMPLIDPELLSEIVSTAADISLLIAVDTTVTAVMVNPHHPAFERLNGWVGRKMSDSEKSRVATVVAKRPSGSRLMRQSRSDMSVSPMRACASPKPLRAARSACSK